jgi:hypothetical protein
VRNEKNVLQSLECQNFQEIIPRFVLRDTYRIICEKEWKNRGEKEGKRKQISNVKSFNFREKLQERI